MQMVSIGTPSSSVTSEAKECRAVWKVIGYVRKSVEKKIKHKSFEMSIVSIFCQVKKMQMTTEY